MSEDKFLSDYSPRDAVWDTQRTLPILSGVSTRLLLNSSAMHSVWPPVAVCYVLVVYHHGNRRNAPTAS